jgi:hypothetical protein
MGRDEAPAMAPVRPPWRLQACSVRARASGVVQETHDEAQIDCHVVFEKAVEYQIKYGDAEFLRFTFHDVFRLSW